MNLLYGLARPLLFSLDAERAHELTLAWAARASRSSIGRGVASALFAPADDPALRTQVFGLDFANPLGLAAGLDKNGVAIDLWAALGFGAVEVGTVTPGSGQPGNDRPRLARVRPASALVNRMGFNNHGANALATQLAQRLTAVPVGANIGKAKVTPLERATQDYLQALAAVVEHADYIVVNVSSPNTPGLRDLQAVESLAPLLEAVVAEGARLAGEGGFAPRPILLKVSPDLADEDLDAVADLALASGAAGLIATNTTIDKSGLGQPAPIEGGVSGAPLSARALACTRRLYARLEGRLPLVGVGGIDGPEAAYQRICAGASLLQIYSALVYQGPALIGRILGGLSSRLAADGYTRVADAVGRDVRGG